jgi:hypothetical protein
MPITRGHMPPANYFTWSVETMKGHTHPLERGAAEALRQRRQVGSTGSRCPRSLSNQGHSVDLQWAGVRRARGIDDDRRERPSEGPSAGLEATPARTTTEAWRISKPDSCGPGQDRGRWRTIGDDCLPDLPSQSVQWRLSILLGAARSSTVARPQ